MLILSDDLTGASDVSSLVEGADKIVYLRDLNSLNEFLAKRAEFFKRYVKNFSQHLVIALPLRFASSKCIEGVLTAFLKQNINIRYIKVDSLARGNWFEIANYYAKTGLKVGCFFQFFEKSRYVCEGRIILDGKGIEGTTYEKEYTGSIVLTDNIISGVDIVEVSSYDVIHRLVDKYDVVLATSAVLSFFLGKRVLKRAALKLRGKIVLINTSYSRTASLQVMDFLQRVMKGTFKMENNYIYSFGSLFKTNIELYSTAAINEDYYFEPTKEYAKRLAKSARNSLDSADWVVVSGGEGAESVVKNGYLSYVATVDEGISLLMDSDEKFVLLKPGSFGCVDFLTSLVL